jgi:hypothetical protein
MTDPSTTTSSAAATGERHLLRHTVATLAYRGEKAIRGAPEHFAGFRVADRTRTPVQILAHIGDLLEWALWLAKGEHVWRTAAPLPWNEEVARFFGALERLDTYLASDAPLGASAGKLFQGPIADALSHVGQLAMLRRLAGAPVRGENYAVAEIRAGRIGPDQAGAANRVEFD